MMRLFSIFALSLLLGAGAMTPSFAAAGCAGHDATASTKSTETVAEVPVQTPAPTTTGTSESGG